VERAYEIEDDEDEWSDDGTASIAGSTMSNMSHLSRASLFSSSSAVPDVSREDFDAILDDFLENYEVVGKKLQPALGGTGLTGAEKLRVLRAAVEGEGDAREENRQMVLRIERESRGLKAAKEKRTRVRDEEGDGDKWDVETILSELNLLNPTMFTDHSKQHIRTPKTIQP
jgi:protein LTV1